MDMEELVFDGYIENEDGEWVDDYFDDCIDDCIYEPDAEDLQV